MHQEKCNHTYMCIHNIYIYIYVYTQYICIHIYICNICNIHVYICSQPQGLLPGHARMMNHLQVGKWISPTKCHLAAWEAPGERAEMVKSMAWFKGKSQPETMVFPQQPWVFPADFPSNQSNGQKMVFVRRIFYGIMGFIGI